MKVAIIGCGAIGGYVGAKLALAGERVTFIACGANLEAVQRRGVRLILADGTEQVASNVTATRDCVTAGAQELVILAVKAHQLEAVAHDVPHLYGPDTVVVTMQNGIPYWYFHHHGGEWAGSVVRSVDPSGVIARLIPPEKVVGCVVYPATELIAPGVEKHIAGAERVGKHKTSMLQDVEAGRVPELEALVGSVVELGRLTGTHTPHIDTVYGLTHLLARTIALPRREA